MKEQIGLSIDYDAEDLDCFVEWKMMGIRDYALGLECGNAYRTEEMSCGKRYSEISCTR